MDANLRRSRAEIKGVLGACDEDFHRPRVLLLLARSNHLPKIIFIRTLWLGSMGIMPIHPELLHIDHNVDLSCAIFKLPLPCLLVYSRRSSCHNRPWSSLAVRCNSCSAGHIARRDPLQFTVQRLNGEPGDTAEGVEVPHGEPSRSGTSIPIHLGICGVKPGHFR